MPRRGSVSGSRHLLYFLRQRHCTALCSLTMASVLTFLLKFLCKLPCKLREFISRCFNSKSLALFLAFLGRKFGLWRPRKNGKNTLRRSEQEQAEDSFPGTGALAGPGLRVDVSQDRAIVACSSIPASARHPSQPDPSVAPSSAGTPPVPASLTAKPQHEHPQTYPMSVFFAGVHSNRSLSSMSIHSACDRLSILQSRSSESLHLPHGQQKGSPKAAHRQFGCGPSTENLEGSSHPHALVNVTGVHGHYGGQSSTTVAVQIENPSTESLPRSQSADPPTLQEESYSIGSPTLYSSPSSKPSNLPEESSQPTPTASLISDFELPEGRFLQMIVSEQVPRYTKSVTV
jgi:hypothetical protein